MELLSDAINEAWMKRYGGEPASDVAALSRRVNLLAQDRDCWLANAQVNQAEYLKLAEKIKQLTKAEDERAT